MFDILEFDDYGEDNCSNQDTTCTDDPDDDYNIDPNGDNYDSEDNDEGTEGNGQYDEGEDFSETLFEAIVELGNQSYTLYFAGEDVQNFSKPSNTSDSDIILWLSKAVRIPNSNKFSLTISISSAVNIEQFQFQLSQDQYEMEVEEIDSQSISIYKYDFDSENQEFNEDIHYFSDVSLYNLSNIKYVDNEEFILSYAYGMNSDLSFSRINDFIINNSNNQNLNISHQLTHLVISFDTNSEHHQIIDNGVDLIFSGLLGDYIPAQRISPDTDKLVIPIGAHMNSMIENLDDISIESNQNIISLSLSSFLVPPQYMYNFSSIVLDPNKLPDIDIFYSK